MELGPGAHPVFGHDWGGAVAWWGALRFPERISRLLISNVPHPAVLRAALRSNPAQRRRSRYMAYFQLPFLPERKLRAGNFAPLRAVFRRTSRPETFSAADLDRYVAAFARPRALTGALNWYRAALWRPPKRPPHRVVEPPTLILWGEDDLALGRELDRAVGGALPRRRARLPAGRRPLGAARGGRRGQSPALAFLPRSR